MPADDPIDPTRDRALVSVLVRSMDRPGLAAALDSVAEQDWRPIEIVVVNARGATHRELPDNWKGLPLRTVGSADGSGLRRAAAANAGLAAARGSLLVLLDDDDQFLPGHLAKLAAALAARPDAVAAYGDVSLGREGPAGWQARHAFDSPFDRERLGFENYLPVNAVLIHRAHSEAVAALRFNTDFDLFEDWDFWLQLAALGDFVHVPGISARYVSDSASGSGVFTESEGTAAARAALFDKWRARSSAEQHARLLQRAQGWFRDATQACAQRDDARASEAAFRSVVAAREGEITALREALDRQAAAAVSAQTDAAQLRAVLAAREAEIASLQSLLAARQREVEEGRQWAASLQATLAAREGELGNLAAALQALHNEHPLQALWRTLKHKFK